MDSQQRGHISSHGSRSNSPQPPQQSFQSQYDGLDPNVNPATFTTGKFNTAQQMHNAYLSQSQMNMQADQHLFSHDQFSQNVYPNNQFPDPSMASAYNPSQFIPGDSLNSQEFGHDFYMSQQYNLNAANNVNPADLSKISSPEHASPGSGLLSPEAHNSPGPQTASPTSTNGQYHTPQHSRHTSLDPSSAYDVNNTWQGMQFQQHRRLPSDQYSDHSSHSPYLAHAEVNDSGDANRSPFLAPQDPNTYGIESFNIADPATSQPGSTYVSPRLMPAQGLGVEPQGQDLGSGEMYPGQQSYAAGAMHNRQHSAVSDIGQADQYAMPTINIEPAPVSRQASFGPQGEPGSNNALSPPSNSRGRNRSQSDTTGMTRPISSRSASPSARQPSDSLSVRSHSPGASPSRESSPGVQSGRISKDRDRRASTSSIHSRDYILDLADPQRPNASPNSGSSRVQKHPATFQCTLCPKKFTRAYNLRSHLRTHTDERPFVCTVCGKAFARQHDRKRHEGLHSGEKKFVCKGELNSQPGQTWGCGRRFARADALGRHFRSEAGRVCIKPLLDEEAAERRAKQMMDHQHLTSAQMNSQYYPGGGLQPVPPGMIVPGMPGDPSSQSQHFALPAALMAQYPQLANLDWNAISQQNMQGDEGDLSDVGGDYGYEGDGMDAPIMAPGMGQEGYSTLTWTGTG